MFQKKRISKKENRGYLYEISISEITNRIEERFWEILNEKENSTQKSKSASSENGLGYKIPKKLEFVVWSLAEERIQRVCSLCKITAKQVTNDILGRLRERNPSYCKKQDL